MANKTLFRSRPSQSLPTTNYRNEAGGLAYTLEAQHALAQYAMTGCLNGTFYASAEMQLEKVLGFCRQCSPNFIAQTAVYARQKGYMKDMPALLCAVLAERAPKMLEKIFDCVIDDAKMIRNFVQMIRSGVVGRQSLGSLPKRLVRNWIERQSVERLFTASVGNNPSLVDIVRMVHPRPLTEERKAFFGYLLGKEYNAENLPQIVKEYETYKKDLAEGRTPESLPNVAFQMLTSEPLSPYEWLQIARNASWQTTRMNLNTFSRNGVFENVGARYDVEKKFPRINTWQVIFPLDRPKEPEPFVYVPKNSLFKGCGIPALEEVVRQQEEEEYQKEKASWQDQWQDNLRAIDIYEETKMNIMARLENEYQEKIRRYIEQEDRRREVVYNRAKSQGHLLKAARKETVRMLADRLRNPEMIARSKVFPYQLMVAFLNAEHVPAEIRNALQDAMEIATANVPEVQGKVYVFPDLSGSMWSSATGHRQGATSKVKCVDIAALVSAAMLRKNPTAEVVPFGTDVVKIDLNPRDSIMTNAQKLSSHCAGGTNCSAPLRYLNKKGASGDLVVYVSDNESWIDYRHYRSGATATMQEWKVFKSRNPSARMVCIDIQPYDSTQAKERDDVINVGGFSDQVFHLIADVAAGHAVAGQWVNIIERSVTLLGNR